MKDKIKRIDYIDIYRTIGILLMVMGHIGFGDKFDLFIHAFHMPMFFFISGYLYKKKDISFKEYFIKKVKSLLIPYAVFGIFHAFIYLYLNGYNAILLNFLWKNTVDLPISGALWFLTTLFFIDMINFILNKYIKSDMICNFIIVIVSIIGFALPQYNIVLPFGISQSFIGILIFRTGYLIKNKLMIELTEDLNIVILLVFIILEVYLIFINGYVNVRTQVYSNYVLFYLNSVISAIILLNVSRIIYKCLPRLINNLLIYIGSNSIIFVCLNQIVILFIMKILNYIGLPLLINHCLTFIISIIILCFITLIFNNTKLKVLLGKF